MAQHQLRQPQRCPSPTKDIEVEDNIVISTDDDDKACSGSGSPSDTKNLRVYRLCKSLSSSSSSIFSAGSVITYMGRHYDAKDHLSSLTSSLESSPSDSTTTTTMRTGGPAQRTPVGRTKSTTALLVPRLPQRQQQRSFSGSLAEMKASLAVGCSVFSNTNTNNNNNNNNNNSTSTNEKSALQSLNYSHEDVVNIVDDRQEFERLKASLKKQGAITNEMLRQGLHFYVKAKKDRDASGIDPTQQQQQQQQQRRRVVRRAKSDRPTTRRATEACVENGEAEQSQNLHASRSSGKLTAEYQNQASI